MKRRVSKSFWLTLLPGIGFWVHLMLWHMDWSVPKPPNAGENWFPVLIQLGLFWLSAATGAFFVVIAVVQTIRKATSLHWWLTALFNLGPEVLWFSAYILHQLLAAAKSEAPL